MNRGRRILAGAIVGATTGLVLGLVLWPIVGNYLVFTTIIGGLLVALDRAFGGEPRGVAKSLFGSIERAMAGGPVSPGSKHFGADPSLPQRWTDVRSFAVVVPLQTPDAHAPESGVRKALKVRDALTVLCQDRYLPDEIFGSIDRKRRAGQALTGEEAKYVKQADVNYLELICHKMEIVVLYEGDFFALSPDERHALHRLVEQFPGCLLVSGHQGIGDRIAHRMNPHGRITEDEAQEVLLDILRRGA